MYRVFGPSLEVTLLVPWALGALTVVPTYLLGRELAGRTAGLVAAMLLATAGAHVVVTSHVVLSHSLTPLCSTFTLWLLARAVMRQSGRSLALAGLGAGISLQTHPTVLPLLAGSAVAVLLVRPAWLRTRWPYLALVLVVVGYSTLLANHVLNGFEVVADIESKQETYLEGGEEAGEAADRGLYLTNLASLSVSLARMTSGEINERETRAEYLVDPWILSYPVLAVLGALIAARRGNPLLLVALAVAVFWPPLFSGKYKPILDGRYLMPDLPVLFVDIAVAFGALAGLVARGAPALRLAGGAAIVAGAVALTLHPLVQLERFYEDSQEDGFSNALYLRTMDQVRAARQADEPVLLDPLLARSRARAAARPRPASRSCSRWTRSRASRSTRPSGRASRRRPWSLPAGWRSSTARRPTAWTTRCAWSRWTASASPARTARTTARTGSGRSRPGSRSAETQKRPPLGLPSSERAPERGSLVMRSSAVQYGRPGTVAISESAAAGSLASIGMTAP